MDKKQHIFDTGISVEDRILEGFCEGCDQDPQKCYEQDYCEYENERRVKNELR